MTLPRLMGIGDVVQESLPQLADAVGDIVDPNRKFNQAMRMLFIQKPELMQKFVDVEKANPGTLKAFGFNQRGTDLLSGMQESLGAMRDRTTRPDVAAALQDPANRRTVATEQATGHTPGQLAADQIGEWFSTGGLQLFQSDPQAAMEALQSKFGMQNPLERRVQGLTGDALNAVEAPVMTQTGNKKMTDMGLPDWSSALRGGQLSNAQLSGALLDPRTKGMATLALKQFENEQELRQRSYYGVQDDIQREKLRRAAMMYDASGQIGSIDAWYEVANPGQRAPGSTRPVTDVERTAVQEASKTERMRSTLGTLRNIDTTRKTALAEIAAAHSSDVRDAAIARLNETLVATDPNIEAYWNDTPWFSGGSDRLSYRNRVTGQAVAAPTAIDTSGPRAPLTGDAQTALTRFRALRARNAAGDNETVTRELGRIKAQNPTLGAQIEAELGTATQ